MSPCGAAIIVAPTISRRLPAANWALILSTSLCCAACGGIAKSAGASQTSATLAGWASVVLANGVAPARKGLAGGGYASGKPAQPARRSARPDAARVRLSRLALMAKPPFVDVKSSFILAHVTVSCSPPVHVDADRARAAAKPTSPATEW